MRRAFIWLVLTALAGCVPQSDTTDSRQSSGPLTLGPVCVQIGGSGNSCNVSPPNPEPSPPTSEEPTASRLPTVGTPNHSQPPHTRGKQKHGRQVTKLTVRNQRRAPAPGC